MRASIGMGDAVRFGERIPGDDGRNNSAFRFALTIVSVTVGTRQDGGGDGLFAVERSGDGLAGSTVSALKDSAATLFWWSQSILGKERGGQKE
jgi:hypothetical protein